MDIHIGARTDEWESPAERLRRLAHPLRLALLALLRRRGEPCVCEIAAALAVEQATLSRHLRILKDGRLVRSRRAGAHVYYTVDSEAFAELIRKLEGALPIGNGRKERNR